jgi:hypothetical protein
MMNATTSGAIRLAVVACALLAGQAAMGKVIATDEFEDGSTRPVSLVVLPSEVTLTKQRLIRQEAQVEESGDLEGHLTAAVAEQFRAHDYDVIVVDVEQIAADPGLQELVVDANRRFDELLTNVGSRIGKSKNVQRREYNAGDEARLLAARLGVDALAFARMQIVAPAAGVRALNLGMGGESTMLTVTIVDGTSGDVEAYITLPVLGRGKMVGGHDDIIENPEQEMANYAEATLEDIPNADPSLRVATSAEDVIEDLESLLE